MVSLNKYENGKFSQISDPVPVEVVPLSTGTLKGNAIDDVVAFWRSYEDVSRDVDKLSITLANTRKMTDKLFYAVAHANMGSDVLAEVTKLKADLDQIDLRLNGNPAKNQIGERNTPTLGDRVFALWRGISTSTYGPTETHKQSMKIIKDQWSEMTNELEAQKAIAKSIADRVVAAGGSWVEGQ